MSQFSHEIPKYNFQTICINLLNYIELTNKIILSHNKLKLDRYDFFTYKIIISQNFKPTFKNYQNLYENRLHS